MLEWNENGRYKIYNIGKSLTALPSVIPDQNQIKIYSFSLSKKVTHFNIFAKLFLKMYFSPIRSAKKWGNESNKDEFFDSRKMSLKKEK